MYAKSIKPFKKIIPLCFSFVLAACGSGGGDSGGGNGSSGSGGGNSGGGSNAPLSIPVPSGLFVNENSNRVTEITLVGGNPLTANLSLSGADAALFTIVDATRQDGSTTVDIKAIEFVAAPDFEAPSDSDTDNAYQISLTATEGEESVSKDFVVNVDGVNDNPPAFPQASRSVTVDENTQLTLLFDATDADGDGLTYSLTNSADRDRFRTIGNRLVFEALPNFEIPQDSNTDNVYEVVVRVNDGNDSDTQTFTVTVNNVDEPISFTNPDTATIDENTQDVMQIVFADPDTDLGAAPSDKLSIVSGVDDHDFFELNGDMLRFRVAPDFEGARSNNTYNVTVQFLENAQSDPVTQNITVRVANVNDNPPTFEAESDGFPFSVSADENDPLSFRIPVSDVDSTNLSLSLDAPLNTFFRFSGNTLNYQLNSGNLDFEALVAGLTGESGVTVTPNVSIEIKFSVTVTDGDFSVTSALVSNEGAYTLTVNNVDDLADIGFTEGGQVTVVDEQFFIDENTTGDLGQITISDVDGFTNAANATDDLLLSDIKIVDASGNQTTSDIFEYVTNTTNPPTIGTLRIKSGVQLDFENPDSSAIDNIYAIRLAVPVVQGGRIPSDRAVANNIDLAFRVVDANDNSPEFDSATKISDGDINTPAQFETIWEIQDGAIQTLNLSANDADADDVVTLCSPGGADASFFVVDGNTLSVSTPLDFENPMNNSGTPNDYVINITASDGACPAGAGDRSSVLTITARVLDANDLPVFVSPEMLSMPENHAQVANMVVTDQDGDEVTFRLSGGSDREFFLMTNEGNQSLRFINTPDFESPSDENADGVYEVRIEANDGLGRSEKSFSVSVTDQTVEITDFSLSALSVPTAKSGVLQAQWTDSSPSVTGYRIARVNPDGSVTDIASLGSADRVAENDVLPVSLDRNASLFELIAEGASGDISTYQADIRGININDLIGYMKASDATENQQFGSGGIDLSSAGDLMVVGAPDTGNGQVYVFERNNLTWEETAILVAGNAGSDDQFGASVALSADGNTLAVGATGEDGLADDQTDAGAVYVFVKDMMGAWVEQAQIRPDTNAAFGAPQFGSRVSLSQDGNSLVIGAMNDDHSAQNESTTVAAIDQANAVTDSGAVYTYSRAGTVWSLQSYLKAPNAASLDQFASGLSLSDNGLVLAVGSQGEDSSATGVGGDQTLNDAQSAGAVYLYQRASTSALWGAPTYIKGDNAQAGDQFGADVALSQNGQTLAVGAPGEDGEFAGVTALSSDVYGNNEGDQRQDAGAVYLFQFTSTWAQQAYIKSPSSDVDDAFGQVVSLSDNGSVLLVGSPSEDSNVFGLNIGDSDISQNNTSPEAGAAYLFNSAAGNWALTSTLKAQVTHDGDQFGTALVISGDGTRSAISAPGDNGSDVGVQADISLQDTQDTGAVYWY